MKLISVMKNIEKIIIKNMQNIRNHYATKKSHFLINGKLYSIKVIHFFIVIININIYSNKMIK